MEHLTRETLARLVDEEPSPDEAAHLRECRACAGDLEAFRGQVAALGRLPDLRPPKGDWEILQARLVSEGLMDGGGVVGGVGRTPGWMKTAAAAALFLVGTGVGAAIGGGPDGAPRPGVGGDDVYRQTSLSFETVEDAAESVRVAERQYMDAWLRYRQMVESEGGGGEALPDPAARIAALEYVVRAGQAALREAPSDPFLNGLLVSALAEREAVLRRTSSAAGENWY